MCPAALVCFLIYAVIAALARDVPCCIAYRPRYKTHKGAGRSRMPRSNCASIRYQSLQTLHRKSVHLFSLAAFAAKLALRQLWPTTLLPGKRRQFVPLTAPQVSLRVLGPGRSSTVPAQQCQHCSDCVHATQRSMVHWEATAVTCQC